jgi:GH24 family phage-related lysozyme (muramidase)
MLSLALFLLPEFYLAYTGELISDPYRVGQAALFMGVFGIIGWFVDQSIPDLKRTAVLAIISALISALIWVAMAGPSWAMDQVHVAPTEVAQSGLPTWEQTAVYAVPMTKRWEGSGPTFSCSQSASGVCVRAYLDRIAEPDLPTICYGETSHTGTRVSMGDVRTIEQCEAGLYRIMRDNYWKAYRRGVTVSSMPAQVDGAMTDLAWNVGPGLVRTSSALRSLNAGDFPDACRRMTFYNKSGGVVVRGLVNRRSWAYGVCMEGVA